MPSIRSLVVGASVAAVAAIPLLVPIADATPVCVAGDRAVCGGRVFPEPMDSATALTYAETVEGLRALAAEFPDWLTVEAFGTSHDGNELLMTELTAPQRGVPTSSRKVVFVSQSIHGNEPGGREGSVRFIEDLLRAEETGDAEDLARRDALKDVRLVQIFLNPDGWQAGDHDGELGGGGLVVGDVDSAGLWIRGNGNGPGVGDVGGVDLNRNAPWKGWIPSGRVPGSEVEMQALITEIAGRRAAGDDLQVSVDIHGEVDEAAAWIMLSAGEFDLAGSMQQRSHGDAVDAAVDAALSDDDLVTLGGSANGLLEPAILTASSEFGSVRADGHGSPSSGSGFLGDWLAQRDGGDTSSMSTIELFNLGATPGLNSLTARREILQVYRDTVAAILGAMIDEATVDHVPSVALPGRVGYVTDKNAVVADPLTGEPRSQFAFFDDLKPYVAEGALVPVRRGHVAPGRLDDFDTIVVATDVLGPYGVRALREFATAGGNVVLTDAALAIADDLVGLSAASVRAVGDDVHTVDFRPGRTTSDPLIDGLRAIAFMTMEPATLGYPASGGSATPAYVVDRAAWETVGTTTALIDGDTAIGTATVGEGTVRIIGHLLPPPLAHPSVLYGIEEYGVLDTGYLVFLKALGADLDVATVRAR